MLLKNNFANIRITNLVTIGSEYVAVMDGKGIAAADNLNIDIHSGWSQISVLDVGSNGTTSFDEYIWIDPAIRPASVHLLSPLQCQDTAVDRRNQYRYLPSHHRQPRNLDEHNHTATADHHGVSV
jgi:hypothetical protein